MNPAPDMTERRLDALRRYAILDTPPEQAFDEIAQLAAEICDAPIALVTLVGRERQWFKAVVGLDLRETPLQQSVCAQVLDEQNVVVIPDTHADPRLVDNTLVRGEPALRFYAGTVLHNEDSIPIGTLCVLDHGPRAAGLTPRQVSALAKLGRQVMAQMELRMIARELREREAWLHAITEALPQMVWAAGPDGSVDYYNRQWYDYVGSAFGADDGEGWLAALHPDDREATAERWKTAVAMRQRYEVEYRLRGRDGMYRWFIGRAVPVCDPSTGVVTRWFGTCTDIEQVVRAREIERHAKSELERLVAERTRELAQSNARLLIEAAERSRAEESLRQAQKMEAIGQLTGGIAHDFNNLLTGILGALELVRIRIASGRTGNLDRFVLAAMMAANRATALTARLLAFARRQPLDARPTDVNDLIGSMADLIRRTVGRAISVTLVQRPDLWPAMCDANQLENALLNLVINARDAMGNGGVLVIEASNATLDANYAATQADLAPGDYIRIEVRDSGCGMPPEVLARVMEPFFTTKPAGQGTGLGMSMLYGFLAQSGGHSQVASQPGEGTSVAVYLPRSSIAATAIRNDVAPPRLPEPGPRGETVLIVEDDATVRMLIRELLSDLGYAILEAADGAAGLRIVQSEASIDLLVTDVGLPGLDGRSLATRARELRPAVKVLFVTSYGAGVEPSDEPLAQGMSLIGKPFSLTDLTAKLTSLTG